MKTDPAPTPTPTAQAYAATWISSVGLGGTIEACCPPYYVVEIGGHAYCSDDGDSWSDENGQPAEGKAFDRASIRLVGGQRNGEVVS